MIKDKATLKARFQNLTAVSAGDFADLIDSQYNIAEISGQSVSGANGAGLNVQTIRSSDIGADTVSADILYSNGSASFNYVEIKNGLFHSTEASASALGTTQNGALRLTKDFNRVIEVSSNSNGVMIRRATGINQTIFNDTNTNLNVYPSTGAAINALSPNTAYVVSASAVKTFYSVTGASTTPMYFTN